MTTPSEPLVYGDARFNINDITFHKPEKRIVKQEDLVTFRTSSTFCELIDFITDLSNSVKGIPILTTQVDSASDLIKSIVSTLNVIRSWVSDYPPLESPMRFGNRAFQDWFDRLDKVRSNESSMVGRDD